VARVQPREQVIVAVDEALRCKAKRLVAALEAAGARTQLVLLPPRSLETASPELLEAAHRADAWISLWERPRRFTAAQHELIRTLRDGGARMLGMPLVNQELLADELSRPLPDLEPAARLLLNALDGATEICIRGDAGTDLTLDIERQDWQTDALPLQAGGIANHPGGEVFTLPRTANGRLVADLTVPYVSDTLLETPIVIEFVDGRATSIEGDAAAERLRGLVANAEGPADRVAELGIGLNPTLSPRGHVLIDEKVAGTAHVAIGSNIHMGGTQAASIHIDCVFRLSELRADGTAVASR
jgi:Thermophilic metalloprotease (M29)